MGHLLQSLYRGGFEGQAVVRRGCLSLQVERVLPKAVDVFGQIGTQARHRLGLDLVAFRRQLMQHARQGIDVVKDQAVSDQVIILDELPLFVTVVLGDQSAPAK